jgi:hypothetical protein
MGGNVDSSKLLSLGSKRKIHCYNGYVFHIKKYKDDINTYNSGVCMKGSTSKEFEFDYYGMLEEVIESQYHRAQNTVFIFKYYWCDIDKEIRVDPFHG